MKIADIIPKLRKGGTERLLLDICNNLQKRKSISVKLIRFRKDGIYKYRQDALVRILRKQSVHSIDRRINKNTINDFYMGVFEFFFVKKNILRHGAP